MKKQLLALLLLFTISVNSQDLNNTSKTEISVLTIGPGESLNDAFGHNGFRVKTGYSDIVYNYGMFDFRAPNFYLNFARGKLDYFIGRNSYKHFKDSYIWQNREIKEQVLNLSETQKTQLISFLNNNLKPENKFYLYDFFYDNCATKMRDVAETVLDSDIEYKTPNTYKEETFRQLIQNNLYWNSWGSLGIDVALGSIIDRKATPREYMFLPENIFRFFQEASFKSSGKSLVKETKTIYKQNGAFKKGSFFISPIFLFSLLGLFIIYITYNNAKKGKRSVWLDVILFTVTGLIGVLIVLLWFATDHSATAFNYNMLWAFPLSIIGIIQVIKKQPKKWFMGYLKLLVVMLCLMTLHWIIGIQRFAPALIPILIALLIRYIYLIRYYKVSLAN